MDCHFGINEWKLPYDQITDWLLKKKLLLLCYSTYLFVYLYLYIYVLNYQFFLVLAAFGPISLFLVTAFLTVLAYKQKRVRFWNYNNNKKKGSRLQDDNAVIVGPQFDFLDCSHDLKKDTPSAQLLFRHATWGRTEERIIEFATVEFTLRRPGTCLFDHARRKKTQDAALVRRFFCPNLKASKLVYLGERRGGGDNCSQHLCSMQPVIFRVPFPEGLRIYHAAEKG